jgi:hypothetical protein
MHIAGFQLRLCTHRRRDKIFTLAGRANLKQYFDFMLLIVNQFLKPHFYGVFKGLRQRLYRDFLQ